MKKISTQSMIVLMFSLFCLIQKNTRAQSTITPNSPLFGSYLYSANPSLSNLSATKINQDLVVDSSGKRSLGSSSLYWKNIYLSGTLLLDGQKFLDNPGQNTYIGVVNNTTSLASDNTFIGWHAGSANTTGEFNVYIGHNAGSANTEGHNNTFIGESAGEISKLAYYDTFIGNQAGAFNDSGSSCVFIGTTTGFHNVHGSYNTFVGKAAGYSNVNGYDNCFMGKNGGYSNQYGYQNTYLGRASGYSGDGINNTFVGAYSGYKDSGSFSVIVGESAAYRWSFGNRNVLIGDSVAISTSKGNNNVYLGFKADGTNDLTNAIAIGYLANVTKDNTVVIGNSSINKIGFGVNANSFNIMQFANTTADLTVGGVWANASDRKLKENFEKLDGRDILNRVKALDVERWNYKIEGKSIKHIGPVAQDFYKLFSVGNDTTITTIDPAGVALVSIKALIDENDSLVAKNEQLQQQYNAQQSQIDDMKKELNDFKTALSQCCVYYNQSQNSNPEKAGVVMDNSVQASLLQNSPNPFSNETVIQYTIPQTFAKAEIHITSENGNTVRIFSVINHSGSLNVKAADFPSGSYHYTLMVDGKESDSKMMIVNH